MIKVPATRAGIPAIEELDRRRYPRQRHAAVRGRALRRGRRSPFQVAGAAARSRPAAGAHRPVASFFASRRYRCARSAARHPGPGAGRHAGGSLTFELARKVPMRCLTVCVSRGSLLPAPVRQRLPGRAPAPRTWPTATCLYVETLIGSDTVNTMPPATWMAFRDHWPRRGHARHRLRSRRSRGRATRRPRHRPCYCHRTFRSRSMSPPS